MSSVQDDDLRQAEKGIPVEEAPPLNSRGIEPNRTKSRKNVWIISIILIVIFLIVGLTTGLVVNSKRQNESSSNSLTANEGGTKPAPSPSPPKTSEPTKAVPPGPTDTPTDAETTSPPNTPSPVKEGPLFYESSSGIFQVKIPLFSSSSVLGYSDASELKKDLTEAVKFRINRFVEQSNTYLSRPVSDEVGTEDELAPDAPAGSASSVAGDVDDFDTNTVEDSIDEGDFLKTNGVYAFAAYGQYVVVWDVKTGEQIINITLPSINFPDGVTPEPIEPYVIEDSTAGSDGGERNLQVIADEYYYWPVAPTVQSLLLHQDRLVVIANGYGQMIRNELDYMPVLYDAFSTNVRIYDISQLGTTGELPLVKETHIHGNFDSVRADGNKVHVVTFSGLDWWSPVEQQLYRYQSQFQDLDDDEYMVAARQLAEDELIPNFVSRLIQDLSVNGELANIARVTMWQKHLSTDSKLEDRVWDNGIMNGFAQVASFDMLDTSSDLTYSMSGTLMPTGWGYTYSTNETLVIAGQGWDWIEEVNGSRQTTYLQGFALLDNGEAVPGAVGSLDGSILNEYSVDVVDNHLRVAVTISNDLWVFEEAEDANAAEDPAPTLRTENYIVVLEIPDANGSGVNDAVMREVGRSQNLGEDGEVFTSVRFSDKIAYAVTFERTDPFYVISFANRTSPEVLGELKISGFSSYLHFINDANTLLLGVGQEANEDGLALGLQVSLFNATNATEPSLLDRYAVELDKNVYSSSSAEWDFKSFRYVKLGENYGILVIPLRIDSYTSTEGNFDGFILLDVSLDGIFERFTIPHVDSTDFRLGCYYWAQLPERSFVVGGNVTTTKGHSIRNYNLDSRERLWGIDLDADRDIQQDQCIYW